MGDARKDIADALDAFEEAEKEAFRALAEGRYRLKYYYRPQVFNRAKLRKDILG